MAEKEYIEREALIDFCKKIIHDRWDKTTTPVSWSHAYADFIDDINNQPAADVAPVKHGHWIYNQDGHDWGLGAWECNLCHSVNNNLPSDQRFSILPQLWVQNGRRQGDDKE